MASLAQKADLAQILLGNLVPINLGDMETSEQVSLCLSAGSFSSPVSAPTQYVHFPGFMNFFANNQLCLLQQPLEKY